MAFDSFDAVFGASTFGIWPLGQHQNSLWAYKTNNPSGMGCNNIPISSISSAGVSDRWAYILGESTIMELDTVTFDVRVAIQ